MVELIYCANGNKRFANIAIECGMLYGAQLPGTVYHWPYFVDQDWKNPSLNRYLEAVQQHRPHMASILDWETEGDLPTVLEWGENIAPFVEIIMIIPKVINGTKQLPSFIGGKPIRLGYSVPTRFGGTSVPIWEFAGWPVHLLGGSPHKQLALAQYLNVVSVDGNMIQKMALRYSASWEPGTARYAKNRYWPQLAETNGVQWGIDAPYEAFRRSCVNIVKSWRAIK